jgi:hypothetical protein
LTYENNLVSFRYGTPCIIFLKKQLLTKFFSSNSGNQGAFYRKKFSRIENGKIRDLRNTIGERDKSKR